MSEEWGPVIQHDGKGCPCVGAFVESEDRSGNIAQHIANGAAFLHANGAFYGVKHDVSLLPSAWTWGEVPERFEIIRYRIRKPPALLDMIERARELDDPPQGPVRVPGKEVVG